MRCRVWTRRDKDQLAGEVLVLLPAPDAAPVPTPGIGMRIPDLDAYERDMHLRSVLRELVAAGLAERVPVAGDNRVFWRCTPQGEKKRRAEQRHG